MQFNMEIEVRDTDRNNRELNESKPNNNNLQQTTLTNNFLKNIDAPNWQEVPILRNGNKKRKINSSTTHTSNKNRFEILKNVDQDIDHEEKKDRQTPIFSYGIEVNKKK